MKMPTRSAENDISCPLRKARVCGTIGGDYDERGSFLEEKEMGQDSQHWLYPPVDADCGTDCVQQPGADDAWDVLFTLDKRWLLLCLLAMVGYVYAEGAGLCTFLRMEGYKSA